MHQSFFCCTPHTFLSSCWKRLAIAVFLLALSLNGHALSRAQLSASYLYNFAQNILWPNEAELREFTIAVYGNDEPQLMATLQQLGGRQLRGLPIRIVKANNLSQLDSYQLLYITSGASSLLREASEALGARPVLLVSSDYPDRQWVMINLVGSADRLLFEVNRPNLINRGLKPLPELILNGGSEIDVARLYREGQASLVDMQKQLQARERNLQQLSDTISEQKQQLQQLQSDIAQSDQQIAQQSLQLNEQLQLLENNKTERAELLREIGNLTDAMEHQKQQLDNIGTQIAQREQRLNQLNSTITSQEREIALQRDAISGLDETVGAQQTALRYMVALVFLAVMLIVSVFVAYQMKIRDNRRLAAQSKDLQIARDRLAIAKRKAEEASQAKGDFLSLMSHELRTPLQAIIGYTEVVIEDLQLVNDFHHVKDLEKVVQNSGRLLRLINSVLDMAKMEVGKMSLDLTEVRLSSLVNEALEITQPLLEKGQIRVQQRVENGAELPLADPEKLLHILTNLLGNACKFAQNGEVNICAEHRPGLLYLTVADTGIGMTAEQQAHIFDPFRQADGGTTRKYQGSGLGLSIARKFCVLMGGDIRVESELNQGATFIVEIPLPIRQSESELVPAAAPLAPVEAAPAPHLDERPNGMPLLIVENELQLFEHLARSPMAANYQFYCANSPADVAQLMRELERPLLVVDPLFSELPALLAQLPQLPPAREVMLWRSLADTDAEALAALSLVAGLFAEKKP